MAGITGSHSALEENALPNIIYAMADDLGYGDVGYNGGIPLTPHLDAMAATTTPSTSHATTVGDLSAPQLEGQCSREETTSHCSMMN